uniref:Transposase n=1 Tax=Ditylenchus dipsaci TaxID=166011 RepID=A0A915D609_9BILA
MREHNICVDETALLSCNVVRQELAIQADSQGWIFPNGSPNLPWPTYRPDLTPCTFFLWRWIKSQVYRTPIEDIEKLVRRIDMAFEELPQEMIDRSIETYRRRLDRCVAVSGRSVAQTFANV